MNRAGRCPAGGGHLGRPWEKLGREASRVSFRLVQGDRRRVVSRATPWMAVMEHSLGDGPGPASMTQSFGGLRAFGCSGVVSRVNRGGARRGLSDDNRGDATVEILSDGAGFAKAKGERSGGRRGLQSPWASTRRGRPVA